MVFTCCAPNCKGNYKGHSKVSTFQFPKDVELRKKWLHALKRESSFIPTNNTRVCEKHFQPSDIIRETSFYDERTGKTLTASLRIPKLKHGALPVILPDCPKYLSKIVNTRETIEERRLRVEGEQLQKAIVESLNTREEYVKRKSFSNFSEFNFQLEENDASIDTDKNFIKVKKPDSTMFLIIENDVERGPKIKSAVIVNQDLNVTVFNGGIKLKKFSGVKINDINELDKILLDIKNLEEAEPDEMMKCYVDIIDDILQNKMSSIASERQLKSIEFLLEQVRILIHKPTRIRYSSNLIIFSALFYTISPHAYKFIRSLGSIFLPHPRTLAKILAQYNTNDRNASYLGYIKERFRSVGEKDKLVVLLMDEIYVKSYMDFKGGNIVGNAFNSKEAAKTCFVFMIRSLLSSFKEVVHIMPVRTIKAEDLYPCIKRLIEGLHGIGFNVIGVSSDNNALNRKSMSFFSSPPDVKALYTHPCSENFPLYFMIDTVHILKCVRNNWLNKKDKDQSLFYPPFPDVSFEEDEDEEEDDIILCTAAFSDIKKLYQLEENRIVKYAPTLNLKSLYPSNLERQNVKFAMNIFNNTVNAALLLLGEEEQLVNYRTTANFVKIVTDWWSIVNVKTVFKGVRCNNSLEFPLTLDSEGYLYLMKMLQWMQLWKRAEKKSGLTNETFNALVQSIEVILQMSKFCIEKLSFTYFLPGKLQTDSLEDRFGKYRTMSGSQYLVSVRQIYEVESKIRLQNILPLKMKSNSFGNINVQNQDIENSVLEEEDKDNPIEDINVDEFNINIDLDIEEIDEILPPSTYIAGYCLRRGLKEIKCDSCQDYYVLQKNDQYQTQNCNVLINAQDRGRLILPHTDVVLAVLITYAVLQNLINKENEPLFLMAKNQRRVLISLSLQEIYKEITFENPDCDHEKHGETLLKFIVRAAANTLLKNYIKVRNDHLSLLPVQAKKRKLNAMQSSSSSA